MPFVYSGNYISFLEKRKVYLVLDVGERAFLNGFPKKLYNRQ